MQLSIIITNYNTRELLRQSLLSIKESTHKITYEIIVVDNNSSDGSREMLNNHFRDIRLISNQCNEGFSKANNQAASVANGKYLLFLNPDTIVYNSALDKMVEYLDTNHNIAILGPKLVNLEGTLQRSCGIYPNLFTEFTIRTFLSRLFPHNRVFGAYLMAGWDYSSPRKVDWVTAACMMVRKDVFCKVQGYDENIFMFYDEVDLCYRVKQLGKNIVFFPQVTVCHIGGGSWRNFREIPIFHNCRSAYYFFQKHYTKWQSMVLKFLLLIEIVLNYSIFIPYLLLIGEDLSGVRARVKGYNACIKFLL